MAVSKNPAELIVSRGSFLSGTWLCFLCCGLFISTLGVTRVDQLCSVFGHQFDQTWKRTGETKKQTSRTRVCSSEGPPQILTVNSFRIPSCRNNWTSKMDIKRTYIHDDRSKIHHHHPPQQTRSSSLRYKPIKMRTYVCIAMAIVSQ